MLISPVYAIDPITNKGLAAGAQAMDAGTGFAFYFATIWKLIVILGGLALILYLAYGGVQWLTAGGDKQKLEKAQSSISNALMGMVILAGGYAIVTFILPILGLDILAGINWNLLAP